MCINTYSEKEKIKEVLKSPENFIPGFLEEKNNNKKNLKIEDAQVVTTSERGNVVRVGLRYRKSQ